MDLSLKLKIVTYITFSAMMIFMFLWGYKSGKCKIPVSEFYGKLAGIVIAVLLMGIVNILQILH